MAGENGGKKAKVEENGGAAEDEGAALLQQVEQLQEIQDELEKINEEASDKVLEVEQEYNEIRRPVYAKRSAILKAIPDFWLTAFLSHPALGELLTDEDRKIFQYLISLDVEDSKDVKSGFSITFSFAPNPHFEDEKLTKVFSFSDEGTTTVSGVKIKWKEGMDISNGCCSISNAAERKGKKRSMDEASFFCWFAETREKGLPEPINDEIADIIKEDLWPNPLKYFNNEVDEDEFDGDEDDEEKGSEDDGDQDDEEEDS